MKIAPPPTRAPPQTALGTSYRLFPSTRLGPQPRLDRANPRPPPLRPLLFPRAPRPSARSFSALGSASPLSWWLLSSCWVGASASAGRSRMSRRRTIAASAKTRSPAVAATATAVTGARVTGTAPAVIVTVMASSLPRKMTRTRLPHRLRPPHRLRRLPPEIWRRWSGQYPVRRISPTLPGTLGGRVGQNLTLGGGPCRLQPRPRSSRARSSAASRWESAGLSSPRSRSPLLRQPRA